MSIDLLADLTATLAAPLNDWLVAQGAAGDVALARPTREGAGDLALPCHPYARALRKAPQAIAAALAETLADHPLLTGAEAAGGFLNLRLNWETVAERVVGWALADDGALGRSAALAGQTVVIEYSSPNTNKPLHLGHCRNNVLGATTARLLREAGADVIRVNLINDRGIHICKSMVAYRRFGDGATPESTGRKGDHLVGEFYVRFDQAARAEFEAWKETAGAEAEGMDADAFFNGPSELGREAREMLLAWEAGDPGVRALWRKMNGWCESGFQATYDRMGVGFDRIDRESETYLLGKDLVAEGLEGGVFRRAENGAVVFDLERIGLEGEKAVLRADGTSVYTTQDLGTAARRADEHAFDRMIYVVGNEQDHHFRVLFGILGAVRPALEGRLFHLSYGMVELPHGKMKSREGTVVDADDLMDGLHDAARLTAAESWPDLPEAELSRRAEAIAQAGLKFYLLKFAPATTFTFDPERSIKPEGETGVYCQYAYARATRILDKLADADAGVAPSWSALTHPTAVQVLAAMLRLPGEVRAAAEELKPSLLTKAIFELARAFAAFYNHPECPVLRADPPEMAARAALVRAARRMLGAALDICGIEALDAM